LWADLGGVEDLDAIRCAARSWARRGLVSLADRVNITLLGEPNIVDKPLARAQEDAIMGTTDGRP
jgi:hypothetical protein